MDRSRRAVLQCLATWPALLTGGCRCRMTYPSPRVEPTMQSATPLKQILAPRRAATVAATTTVVDAHAHFFNASDVPVRGFVAECLGHRAPAAVQPLLRALAGLADKLAERAPTAADELTSLRALASNAPADATAAADTVTNAFASERERAAESAAQVIRGTAFEREYRRLTAGLGAASITTGPITRSEILGILEESEVPAVPGTPRHAAADPSTTPAQADGVLAFLTYMLSARWVNLQAYMRAYTTHEAAVGIDKTVGALVDFDRWLDCPPLSAHEDQIELHALISELSGGYLRPAVAYNPWTDIDQSGASLTRLERACTQLGFVAAKIYPPTGFMPAGNKGAPSTSSKRRPDLGALDAALDRFFERCAALDLPVIAHAARSNGRDNEHDEFGGPTAWATRLRQHATAARVRIDFGHFGGGAGVNWTDGFARLIGEHGAARLYADLGYWEELMCTSRPGPVCDNARKRLADAVRVRISDTETVADRTLFATDWLMLSQVKRWADYPTEVRDSLRMILPDPVVTKILGQNAASFFKLLPT